MRIPAVDVSTYPDLSLVCGDPVRDEKLMYYAALTSLRDYVLVSQHRVVVDHFERRPDGSWLFRQLGPGDVIGLRSVKLRLRVEELYDGVRLEARTGRLRVTD